MRYALVSVVVLLAASWAISADKPSVSAGDKKVQTTTNGCRIERYTIPSAAMGKDVRVAVVLPPGYDQEKARRYPIVYTLHGYGAPYDTFANMSRFTSALSEAPMIYTCFDGGTGRYIDAPEKSDSQYKTFFFEEFIPYMDAQYRTNGQRGLVGFSMGGCGAMYYTLQKPEMFVATCCLSSSFRSYANLEEGRAAKIAPLLGEFETNRERYEAVDVFALMRKQAAADADLPAFMIRCGTEDFLLQNNRDFRTLLVELNAARRKEVADGLADMPDGRAKRRKVQKLMAERSIDFSYTEQPGGHNWTYWHGQAPAFARFFRLEFAKDAAKKASRR